MIIRLRNNTGARTKIGYLVKADVRNNKAFVYAGVNETNIIGVTGEVVEKNNLCNIITGGNAKIYVSGGIIQGSGVRSRKSGDNISNGTAKRIASSDTTYYNVGTALKTLPKNGLVDCYLNLHYVGGTTDAAELEGNLDGGEPDTVYGGIDPIEGGSA